MPNVGIDQPMSRSTLPANVLWREISFELPNTPSVVLVVDRTLTPRERQSRVAQCGRSMRPPKPKKNLAFADAMQGVLL